MPGELTAQEFRQRLVVRDRSGGRRITVTYRNPLLAAIARMVAAKAVLRTDRNETQRVFWRARAFYAASSLIGLIFAALSVSALRDGSWSAALFLGAFPALVGIGLYAAPYRLEIHEHEVALYQSTVIPFCEISGVEFAIRSGRRGTRFASVELARHGKPAFSITGFGQSLAVYEAIHAVWSASRGSDSAR